MATDKEIAKMGNETAVMIMVNRKNHELARQ
jgi:hypothetical protein